MGMCLLGLPTAAYAANNCPWINEATASGFLGGDSVGMFTSATAGQPAECLFTQQREGFARTLRITMEIATDPHANLNSILQTCGADQAPIKAIGNEAFACSESARKGAMGERVLGRVRDQVFTITLGTTLKDDPILTRDELKTRIYTVAEQVAGNLF